MLAAGLLAVAVMSGAAAPSQQKPDIVITERLVVRADTDDVPKATVTSVVDVPRSTKLIRVGDLSRASPDDAEYRDALARATGGTWLSGRPFSVTVPFNSVPHPRPRLDAERARITAGAFDWIRGYEDGRPLGDWFVYARRDRMTFSLPLDIASVVPRVPRLDLNVVVESHGADLVFATAIPRELGANGQAVWRLRNHGGVSPVGVWRDSSGEPISEFWVTLRPRGTPRWFMRTNSGAFWWALQPLANVLAWVTGLLLLVVALRRRPGRRTLLLVPATVLLAVIAMFEQYRTTVFREFPLWAGWALAVEVALVLAAAAGAALPRRGRRVALPGVLIGAAAVAYLAVLPGSNPLHVSRALNVSAGVASVVLTVELAAVALIRLWPRRIAAVAVLVCTVPLAWAAWWVLAVAADSRSLGRLGFVDAYGSAAATMGDAIQQAAVNFPGWFADAAVGWLPFAVVPIALAALAADAKAPPTAVPPRRAALIVVALFASFVGGPWGSIFWIHVPLMALVTAALMWSLVVRGYARRGTGVREHLVPPALRFRGQSAAPAQDVLSPGPTGDWFGNGARAARIGALVAIPFAVHYLALWFGANAKDLAPEASPVGAIWGLEQLVFEYAFWITAAFTLGALYPLLPGRNGVLKGVVLAAIFAVAQGAAELLPGTFDVMSWPTIVAEQALFSMIVGVLLDRETVARSPRAKDGVLKVYGLNSNTEILLGALPFVGTVAVLLLQQVISGDAAESISDVLQTVPSLGPTSAGR